jgi:hypothetical protein
METIRYKGSADDYICDLTATPKSTHAIAKAAKFKFPTMHYMTVRNILRRLAKEGKVDMAKIGKMEIWSLPEKRPKNPISDQ